MLLLKKSIKNLINKINLASGGEREKSINESRIGIITFSNIANGLVNLTNNIENIDEKIDSLTASGKTNHYLAFNMINSYIDEKSSNKKVVVMFTDGITTIGPCPDNLVRDLQRKNVEVYCIGITEDNKNFVKWASEPTEKHITNTSQMDDITDEINTMINKIIKIGAQNIVITEKVNDNFKINKINSPSHGNLKYKDFQTIIWTIDEIGLSNEEEAICTFDITYLKNDLGKKFINDYITYEDEEENKIEFANPNIEITDNSIIEIDEGNTEEFTLDPCENKKSITNTNNIIQNTGRIITINTQVEGVCPNKKIVLGFVLFEIIDENEIEIGNKIILIPPIAKEQCSTILVKDICFIVPDETNQKSICNKRQFKVKIISNYLEN